MDVYEELIRLRRLRQKCAIIVWIFFLQVGDPFLLGGMVRPGRTGILKRAGG